MQVKDLIYNNNLNDLDIVKSNCSQFIQESGGFPVLRNLPLTYENVQKVKVRKRKHTNNFSNVFNNAFSDEVLNLRERAVFANGNIKLEANLDPFYVFPVNGYEFLYSREVGDSTESYRQVFESIFDTWGDEETATDIVNDLLRFTYVSEDLSTGINTGAEIIFYSIPHYFAIRESCVESYDSLLTSLI